MAAQTGGKKSKNKNGTIVLSCTCRNKYQDATYGSGRRLHNLCVKGARCTVCSAIHDVAVRVVVEEKKDDARGKKQKAAS